MEVRNFPYPLDSGTQWALNNLSEISIALLRDKPHHWHIYVQNAYRRGSFLLSEMALCTIYQRQFQQSLGLPEGYSIVPFPNGSVTYRSLETGKKKTDDHGYLKKIESGREKIFDLNAAQFFVEDWDAKDSRGNAMEKMEQMARAAGKPQLYTRLSEDIAVLEGYADEIKKVFGLKYH